MKTVHEDIFPAGEKALTCLYGGCIGDGLDQLRQRRFCEKVSASPSSVQVLSLPPKSASARYHSSRTFYQVHEWMGENGLKPDDWGCIKVQNRLEPIMP